MSQLLGTAVSHSSCPVAASMAARAPHHSLTSTSTTPAPQFAFLEYFTRSKTTSPAEWTDRLASLADKAALTSNISPNHQAALTSDTSPNHQVALTSDTSQNHEAAIPYEPFTMLISPTAWLNTFHAAIGVRAEGPYFTPADPARYHTVVCIVAGTGISGALAIIGAFAAQKLRDADNIAEMDRCMPGTCSAVQEPTPVPVDGRGTWERCVDPKPGSAGPSHWERKAEAGCCEDAGGREGAGTENVGLSVGTEFVYPGGGGGL
ncbi:hypothetical protein V494_05372 [Pseudogymnoascus sp. VKM F-4513 (FW-928)]|nr:hypothetical protein V494_05372 [Pseudogymnoascus sp. VKM F-4513 (FW-928)]